MSLPNHFMVVDDDPTSNMICRFIIQGFNPAAEIRLFTEPEAALEAIARTYGEATEKPPAILFLDLNMPSMTGWEFLEEFSKMDQQVKEPFVIYVLSSSLNVDDMEQAVNHSLVTGFISKPLTKDIMRQEFSQG